MDDARFKGSAQVLQCVQPIHGSEVSALSYLGNRNFNEFMQRIQRVGILSRGIHLRDASSSDSLLVLSMPDDIVSTWLEVALPDPQLLQPLPEPAPVLLTGLRHAIGRSVKGEENEAALVRSRLTTQLRSRIVRGRARFGETLDAAYRQTGCPFLTSSGPTGHPCQCFCTCTRYSMPTTICLNSPPKRYASTVTTHPSGGHSRLFKRIAPFGHLTMQRERQICSRRT